MGSDSAYGEPFYKEEHKMREILFRGKRVSGCGWLVSQTLWNANGNIFLRDDTGKWIHVVSETVGQFTGLTDKNGKRIFEGDIVKDNKNSGIVKYFESIGCFVVMVGNDLWNLNENDPNRQTKLQYTEVIGNIHDNPELLEWEEPEEEGE